MDRFSPEKLSYKRVNCPGFGTHQDSNLFQSFGTLVYKRTCHCNYYFDISARNVMITYANAGGLH